MMKFVPLKLTIMLGGTSLLIEYRISCSLPGSPFIMAISESESSLPPLSSIDSGCTNPSYLKGRTAHVS
jgi:hypothetical protein